MFISRERRRPFATYGYGAPGARASSCRKEAVDKAASYFCSCLGWQPSQVVDEDRASRDRERAHLHAHAARGVQAISITRLHGLARLIIVPIGKIPMRTYERSRGRRQYAT